MRRVCVLDVKRVENKKAHERKQISIFNNKIDLNLHKEKYF